MSCSVFGGREMIVVSDGVQQSIIKKWAQKESNHDLIYHNNPKKSQIVI